MDHQHDPASDSRPRVLVVDDDEALLRAHSQVLTRHGYEAETAVDGSTALAAARRSRFDLVISDINMRPMNGLALVSALRAEGLDVPVVLMTGEPALDTAMQAVELGVVRYLAKPVDPPRLVQAVSEGIRVHGLARIRRLDVDNEGLRVLVEELQRAKAAALAGMRAKTEFLSKVSHELRTPLSTVLASTALVLDGELAAEQRARLETSHAAAEHLLHIINNLLELADLAGGRLQLAAADLDLRSVLAARVERYHAAAAAKGVPVTLEVDDDVPVTLVGDAARLGQVVDLLLDNAVRFTSRGRIVVRVHVLGRDAATASIRITVADTGAGIPAPAQGKVTEPFVQGDDSSTRVHGGMGVGLAIASELAGLMNGSLAIESAVDVGTTVRLTVELGQPIEDDSFFVVDTFSAS